MKLFYLNVLRSRTVTNPKILQLLLSIRSLVYKILRKFEKMDVERFIDANSLPTSQTRTLSKKRIGIVIVSTNKDFEALPLTIKFAVKSVRNYELTRITIIVPKQDVESCKTILIDVKEPLQILDESMFVSDVEVSRLRTNFLGRTNWVLQQILKVVAALDSVEDGILIVDSDTLLLHNRFWLKSHGSQILCPTEEFNKPYYDFLSSIGVCDSNPKYTFVSHHIMYQPILLREILAKLNIYDVRDLIKLSLQTDLNKSNSPLCIDYELYAQSLVSQFPDRVFYEKWSNIAISRRKLQQISNSKFRIFLYSKFFNSISFHSWS